MNVEKDYIHSRLWENVRLQADLLLSMWGKTFTARTNLDPRIEYKNLANLIGQFKDSSTYGRGKKKHPKVVFFSTFSRTSAHSSIFSLEFYWDLATTFFPICFEASLLNEKNLGLVFLLTFILKIFFLLSHRTSGSPTARFDGWEKSNPDRWILFFPPFKFWSRKN